MNLRLLILILGVGIAGCGAVLAIAATEPPLYPVPGAIVAIVTVLNAMLGFAMTQVSSWRDAEPEIRRAIDVAHRHQDEGHDPVRLINLGHRVEEVGAEQALKEQRRMMFASSAPPGFPPMGVPIGSVKPPKEPDEGGDVAV
jgi:hypothetical protein